MHYLTQHWTFDPFLVIAVLLVAWHEIGLRRLALRSRPERTRQRRLRSLLFYAGLAVLVLAVESPLDYWADDYFFIHMIQHLLLMFAAPSLVVAGAPWQPLLDALPGHTGREATREVMTADWSRPLRAVTSFLLRPWTAVIAFSGTMVFWHIPVFFNLAQDNQAVHIWLTHGSFFIAGLLFWLQFIPSPPFRSQMPALGRAGALLGTNVIMIVLAMSLSIFVRDPIYSSYSHLAGVTLPQYADQQIGAAILWVCGDFWALPTMIITVRKVIADEGGVGTALDRFVRRGSSARTWGTWGTPPRATGTRKPEPAKTPPGRL